MLIQTKALRRTAVGFATGALVLAGALLTPAHAVPTWTLGYDDGNKAVTGQTISNINTVADPSVIGFSGVYNGVPATISCSIAAGTLSYTVPATVPSAAPGGTVSVALTPPSTINGCTESVTGNPVTAYIKPGTTWTLAVTAPAGSTPNPFDGTLNGSITVPQNTMVVRSNFLADQTGNPPCVIMGPSDGDLVVPGAYDADPLSATAGHATPTSLPKFEIDPEVLATDAPWYTSTNFNPCPVDAADGPGTVSPQLLSATVSLRGPGGLIPTVVYTP